MLRHSGSSADFSTRLKQVREDHGLTQSDLARAIWGEEINAEGYTVARNRDRISAYERGNSRPNPENFGKICEVLGSEPKDLWPDALSRRVPMGTRPVFTFTALEADPTKVRLDVNAVLPLKVGLEVLSLIKAHVDPDGDDT